MNHLNESSAQLRYLRGAHQLKHERGLLRVAVAIGEVEGVHHHLIHKLHTRHLSEKGQQERGASHSGDTQLHQHMAHQHPVWPCKPPLCAPSAWRGIGPGGGLPVGSFHAPLRRSRHCPVSEAPSSTVLAHSPARPTSTPLCKPINSVHHGLHGMEYTAHLVSGSSPHRYPYALHGP